MNTDNISYNVILTNKCFLLCGHCFVKKKNPKTLSPELLYRMSQRICAGSESFTTINWGGGDPLSLGKQYLKGLVSLPCFKQKRITNALYSTFLIRFDDEWLSILQNFDSLMYSMDSYRESQIGQRIDYVIPALSQLPIEKAVSYTPCVSDTHEDLDRFYLRAQRLGANTFHVGFLYSDEPIPAAHYINTIDHLLSLQMRHGMPRIGFFPKNDYSSTKVQNALGWRAYDCFTKGAYISLDGIITSCHMTYNAGIGVPSISLEQFFNDRSLSIPSLNADFISSFYFRNRPQECYGCDKFSLCMGGCPHFSNKSPHSKDIYCQVYRHILNNLLQI
jgi:radical SAM protein with 4Fe4S-binding SPASM domain